MVFPQDDAVITPEYCNRWRWGWQVFAIFLMWILGITLFRYKVIGREKLPSRSTPCILVSNHMSNWDPPMMAMVVRWRPISYMAKKELFEHPVSRWMYRNLGAFSVNREKVEKKSIKSAKMVLTQTNWFLGMFAEGTRITDPDNLGPIKEGVAGIAKMAQVPILPVGLFHNGKRFGFVIGDMMPVPTDITETTEQLRQTLHDLKQQARQLTESL